MVFSLKFTSELSETAALAEIEVDDLKELLEVPTTYWTKQDYINQWREAVGRIINAESDKSILFVSMLDPKKANFLFTWPMYRYNDTVFIQNHLLFLKDLPEKFDEGDPYASIPIRETASDDNEPISEWEIDIIDLKKWYESTAFERGACEVCGFLTFAADERGDYFICPVCFWEDDEFHSDPNEPCGVNHDLSLNEARENYKKYGACAKDMIPHVRKPRPNEMPK